ncbi:hypothetical protein [Nitrosomonas ureae]|uniref:Uncharacterized protein n=1 Tax=Nitrosomonas ureae TaxID=44577 RepID=A0A2T5IEB8_9PROT|nr:hypothetical protein [Nitrosomonas ureae]PTQ82176.1 hypothetical protein C8R28_102813 [Nitrosomonas ureae]PXX17602.1 hypothetical protein C8R27_10313 [Nitrosomonas ureae]
MTIHHPNGIIIKILGTEGKRPDAQIEGLGEMRTGGSNPVIRLG